MSWSPNKALLARAAVAALAAAAAASAAANVLVVRSTGPSAATYPAGRSLPDNARIALRDGDTIVLLGPGGTRTFRGPGTFSPSAPVQAAPVTASAQGTRRARIGAVRQAGTVPMSPTIWHVDVTQSGRICLADASAVTLWRADAGQPATFTITPPGGAPTQVEWPAGQATLAWPASVPVTQGDYRIAWPDSPVPTRISFRTLASVPTDLPSVAAALIEQDCQEQLDLLIESTAEAG